MQGDVGSGVIGGGGVASSGAPAHRPNTLPAATNPVALKSTGAPQASQSLPSSPPSFDSGLRPQKSPMTPALAVSPQSRFDFFRTWSFNTYKFTRQLLSERLGRGSRTVDAELEAQIETLRDVQSKYANVLKLTRALTNHFYQVIQTQRALADAFSSLSQKNPELHEEFTYNSETQRVLFKNGETLLGALNFFISGMNTLCNKTIDDTLLTVKNYEDARVEYDAYRLDLEALRQSSVRNLAYSQKLVDAEQRFRFHTDKFERLRGDVIIKMKFLDDNRVKVMHKKLLFFHNAIASYFTGNQASLEDTLKQFNIKLKAPNSDRPSWLETH